MQKNELSLYVESAGSIFGQIARALKEDEDLTVDEAMQQTYLVMKDLAEIIVGKKIV